MEGASGTQKRGREDELNEFVVPPKKQMCGEIRFVAEVSSPILSENESVHSMQGWETELCQDTSDTSDTTTHDEDSLDMSPISFLKDHSNVEFEVDSLSEAENPFGINSSDGTDSSSGDNDCCVKVSEIVVVDKEEEFWGDDSHSDTDTSTDQEIPSSDFWTCLRCKCVNKPIPRYCIKCFQVRKNWFPPRPRRKHTARKSRKKNQNVSKECTDSGIGSFSKKDDEEVLDSEIPTTSTFNRKPKQGTVLNGTKGAGSGVNCDKCITCMEGPKNAAFVHGNVGHICCCYRCAKKAWSRSGKCPVCNRKSNRVIKVFFA